MILGGIEADNPRIMRHLRRLAVSRSLPARTFRQFTRNRQALSVYAPGVCYRSDGYSRAMRLDSPRPSPENQAMTHHGFLRVAAAVPDAARRRLRLQRRAHPRPASQQAEAEGVAVARLPRAVPDRLHLRRPVPPDRPAARRRSTPWSNWSPASASGLPRPGHRRPAAGRGRSALQLRRRRCSRADSSASCPKSFLPNYKEFYEAPLVRPGRHAPAAARSSLDGQDVPFGTDLLFDAADVAGLIVGVEICEDLWVPVPPSSLPGAGRGDGAAQPVGQQRGHRQGRLSPAARRQPVGPLPRRLRLRLVRRARIDDRRRLRRPLPDRRERHAAGRVASASSATSTLLVADVDLDRLRSDRLRTNSFGDAAARRRHGRELSRASPFDLDAADGAARLRPRRRRPPVRAARPGAAARTLRGDLPHPGRRPGQAAGAHRQAAA